MSAKYLISILVLSSIFQNAMAQNSTRIRHSVIFKLKSAKGSQEATNFMIAAKKLATIPGVEKFEYLKQISKKNKFEYCISMEFANQETYNKYTNHTDHIAFVQTYWQKDVEDFLEIDYQLEE